MLLNRGRLSIPKIVLALCLSIAIILSNMMVGQHVNIAGGPEKVDQSYIRNQDPEGRRGNPEPAKRSSDVSIPHLAVVICGEMRDEALVMLKSVALFTKSFLVIHIVTDSTDIEEHIKSELESWPSEVKGRIQYIFYKASFPPDIECEDCEANGTEWKSLFRPCATQRLFFGDVLSDVDSVVYVDADTVFLAPIEEIWSKLYTTFNSTQFLAAVSTSEPSIKNPYQKRDIAYYGINGINSGVLLMNLTRLRLSSWSTSITQALIGIGKETVYADQDLINIYMHDHPEHSFMLSCDWNFRQHQCLECEQADKSGAAIIHGVSKSFKSNTHNLPLKAVYTAFKEFNLGKDSVQHDLLPAIERNLEEVKEQKTNNEAAVCNSKPEVLTKRIKDFISANRDL